MSKDIKMADVFDLPLNADIEAVYDCEGGELAAFNKVSEDVAAVQAINNHDKLVKQVAELRALVIKSIDRLNDCIAQDDAQAYKEAEKFIDIANKTLEENQ